MAKTGSAIAAFLEAHYYSGGLIHHHVSLAGARPEWAPPFDDAGFRDEIPLTTGDHVIEFQHRKFKEKLLTWVAIYSPAGDEMQGDRANHSGVGLWLCGLSLTDARSALHGLQQLLSVVVSGTFNATNFERSAAEFLSDWLPGYVQDTAPFQLGFSGVKFAESALTGTSIYELITDGVTEPFDLAAQKVTMLSFADLVNHPSRALIYIPKDKERRLAGEKTKLIKADTDYLSEFISHIPNVLQGASTELISLKNKSEKLSSELNILLREKENLNKALLEAARDRDEAIQRVSILKQQNSNSDFARDIRDIKFKLDTLQSGQSKFERETKKSAVGSDIRTRAAQSDLGTRGKGSPTSRPANKKRGFLSYTLVYGLPILAAISLLALGLWFGPAALRWMHN